MYYHTTKGAQIAGHKKRVEATVRDPFVLAASASVRRATPKKYTTEEKVRIVQEGLRGKCTIAELCRRKGIQPDLYYKWSKEFQEVGNQRLIEDTQRQADNLEEVEMRSEFEQLKQAVTELTAKHRCRHLPWRAVPGKKACCGKATP